MAFSIGAIFTTILDNIARYWWIGALILVPLTIFGVVYWLSRLKAKKEQWTHTFKVRRLLQNGTLTEETVHKARRFPLEKGVEMFELEKPILGSYLIPQPSEYTGVNEFSIILDSHNRIWANKGYKFNKDSQSLEVSAVHAGIDVEMAAMKDKWQQAHRVAKRITAMDIINSALKLIAIIAITIILIMALKEWGQAQKFKAEEAAANAEAMKHIGEAVATIEKVVNTQQLQIVPMLKALYGSDNIAEEINKYRESSENVDS